MSDPPPTHDPDATVAQPASDDDATLFVERGDTPASAAAPFRIGPYLVENELGRGGMGVVYRARDPELGRTVAVKVLPGHFAFHPQARARFRREAEAASKLDHPGLCGIIAVGEEDGIPWIAMPFIEGVPLATIIERARAGGVSAVTSPGAPVGRSPTDGWRASVELIATIARALHVAHERGVLHRDLKPGNVMIRPDGRPVVLDFGLACDTHDDGPALTESGDVLGTPGYMAPEQIRGGSHRAGPTLDVWALGVMLYELLTLEQPFAAPTREGVYLDILEREPLSLRRRGVRVPGDLQAVLTVALEKDPKRRYATAQALADDLRRVLDIEPILAHAPGPVDKLVKLARRRPALTGLLTLLAIVVPTMLGLWVDRILTHRRVAAGVGERLDAVAAALERHEPIRARRLLGDVRTLAPDHPQIPDLATRIDRGVTFARLEALVLDREVDPSGALCRAELAAARARWPRSRRLDGLERLLALRTGQAPPSRAPSPDDPLQRALELSASGRHEDALEQLEALLERNPAAHWIAWAAADEASRVQRYDEALALARAARAASSELGPRRLGRYSLHLRRAGELDLALEHARAAHAADPDDVVLRLHLANALAELRLRDEAAVHLEAALASEPTFAEAWRALGALQFDEKEFTAAEASLRRAIDLNPRSAETAFNLANTLIELERFDEGLSWLDRTLELNEDFVYALNSKGHTLRRLGRYEEAKAVLGEALAKSPRYAEAIANLASVHFAEGDVATAEKLYREAAALAPRSDKILFNLALLLHNGGGDPHEVIALYRRVLAVRPDDATSLTNVANLLTTIGEHGEAVKMARRSTEVAPDDPVNWNNLATSCVEAGRLEEAVGALERALELDPAMLQPHVNLMVILQESDPLRALAHALEVPRLDEAIGLQARANVALLRGSLEDVDHILVEAMEALDVIGEDREEAAEIVAECVDAACALPGGRVGSREWIVARSTAILLLDLANELGLDCAPRLARRAAELGYSPD